MCRSPEGWMPLKMRDMGVKAIKKADPTQLLSAAQLAASRAASFLREQEGRMTPDTWSIKGQADFVTEVDRESERMISADLLKAFPDSAIMGEELTPDAP